MSGFEAVLEEGKLKGGGTRTVEVDGATVPSWGTMREDRSANVDSLDPDDPLRILRGVGLSPLLSSVGLGWRGLKLERYRHSLREIDQPPFENHLVVLVVRPFRVERHRDGRVDEVCHVPGDVGLVSAGGSAARWTFEGEADQLHLSLEPVFVEEVAEEIGADGDRAELLDTFRTRDPRVEWIVLSLKAELEAGGALGGKLYAESLATTLAVHLLREHSSLGWRVGRKASREPVPGLPAHALRQALDYIGDNLASDLSLAGMAVAAGFSPHHFSRLFKLSTGLPPYRYVIRERVEKAKALLTNTEMPVGQVALACGFSHQAHLNRHFGRLTGTTPGKFRR